MSKRKQVEEDKSLYDINKPYLKKVKQTHVFRKEDLETERYHCDYCKKDITAEVRIRCAKCSEFDLCVDCFFVGVETQQHKNDHPYRVIENQQASILSTNWTIEEELLLLEGLCISGLGNWIDISEHVGKSKSKYECEYHYWTLYVDRPLAKRRLELLQQQKQQQQQAASSSTASSEAATASSSTTTTQAPTTEPPSSEEDDEWVPIPDCRAPLQQDRAIAKKDVKKDDDGVLLCSKKEFGWPELDLKKIFEENKRAVEPRYVMGSLLSREPIITGKGKNVYQLGSDVGYLPLRADFETDYDNAAEELIGELEITEEDSPEERERKLNLLRLYEFRLSERERRKRFAIERGLYDWKRISAIEKKRTKMERELFQKYRPFARFLDSQEEFEQFMAGIVQEMKIRQRIQQLKEYRENGLVTLQQCDIFDTDTKKREGESDLKRARESGPKTPSASRRTIENLMGTSKDSTTYVGLELLSKREKTLCSELQLYPKHYILVKDALVKESLQMGFISKSTAYKLLSDMDKDKVNKIYDFFVSNSWISGSPHQTEGNTSSGKQ